MTVRSGGAAPRISVVAVVAALVFAIAGFYPLPAMLPDHAGLSSADVRYWIGASLLTLGPVLVLAALPFAALRALPRRLMAIVRRPPPPAFALLVGALFASASVVLAWYAFRFAPTTAQEIAQLWHARILLHGRLALPADPNFEFFAVDHVIDRGAWRSPYPIGGPLVLTLGYLMRARWLLNPLLGAGTAMLLYHVARRAYGDSQGRVVAALFALTPAALLMSARYMNHVPALFLAVASLALLAEWERAASPRRRQTLAALIGLCLGFMATIRPLDAVAVSVCVGVFQVVQIRRAPARWRELAVQAAAGAVGVAPLLYANWATAGGIFHFAYDAMWEPVRGPGVHGGPTGLPQALLTALAPAARSVAALNASVLAWPLPALLVAVAGLLSMRRITRWDALLLGLFGAQLVACALGGRDGESLGPRALYTALPTLVVLIARTPFLVADRWGGYWRHAAPLGALTCLAVAWLLPMGPYGALGLAREAHAAHESYTVDLAGAVRAAGIHHAVVFVHEPFGGRLMRRLWGVGFTRRAAAQAFARGDACSVLDAVTAAEADTTQPFDQRAQFAADRIATYAPGATPIRAVDSTIHISSALSLTPACRAELALDVRYGGMPFGNGLLLETIGPDGRIGGDVVYAADLGAHDEVLRARFGDRRWYRAWTERGPGGVLRAAVSPY